MVVRPATNGRFLVEVLDNVVVRDWPNRRLRDLLDIEMPIIQVPMAGSDPVDLARSVSSTGAPGSLAYALLSPDAVRENARAIGEGLNRPLNLNFFCHTMMAPDDDARVSWKNIRQTMKGGAKGVLPQIW